MLDHLHLCGFDLIFQQYAIRLHYAQLHGFINYIDTDCKADLCTTLPWTLGHKTIQENNRIMHMERA